MIDWTDPQPPKPRVVASICRCSSPQEHASRAASFATERASYELAMAKKREDRAIERAAELAARTPNPYQYEVEEVEQVGPHLVLRVKYPSCAACAFEGSKVMVFLNVPALAPIRWRRIDPHFRSTAPTRNEAPSPAARFPATTEGWCDAVTYARSKCP